MDVAPERRATTRARPVNSDDPLDRSAADNPSGSGRHAASTGAQPSVAVDPLGVGEVGKHTSAPPPDHRPTTILPPVRGDLDPALRDPIDVVKRALDGTPAPPQAPPPLPPKPPRTGGGGNDGVPPARRRG